MITIPLYIFLFTFFAVVIGCAIFFCILVYHLASGASLTLPSFIFTFFILSIMVLVIYGAWFVLQDVDWGHEVFQFFIPFYGGDGPTPFVE